MGKLKINIKDSLNHHRYRWPETLVRYQVEFESGQAHIDSLTLEDENGETVSMQMADEVIEDGFVKSAKVCFITDLPTGADRCYFLNYGRILEQTHLDVTKMKSIKTGNDNDFLIIDNDRISLKSPAYSKKFDSPVSTESLPPLFLIETPEKGMLADARLCSSRKVRELTSRCGLSGPVFHEQVITCIFDDMSSYSVTLRLIEDMEFIEMEEKMRGFDSEEPVSLNIKWKDFNNGVRYALNRKREKIDAYLDRDGRIPFKVFSYPNWASLWRTRAASFLNYRQKYTTGVFVRDALKWDDGQYDIWGPSDTLALEFYYSGGEPGQGGELVWKYPVAEGSRSTAIALYGIEEEQTAWSSEMDTDYGRDYSRSIESHINELWLWYSLLNLDKVKDWVLDWNELQHEYPRYFDMDSIPSERVHLWFFNKSKVPEPSDMEEIVEKLSGQMNNPFYTSPVQSREFASWVPIFDMSARRMTPGQFKKCMAACALMAYIRMEEDIMPVNNMLAGHPNFMGDMVMVPGMMAGLFPNHPHADKWLEHFEKVMALNLKYHTRPDIKTWEARGGRWTENLGTYVWAALKPMVRTGSLLRRTRGADPLLYPNIVKLANWLLNCLSAPVDGERSYPPQGAHSGADHDPMPAYFELRILGELLMRYEPLLAEHILSVSLPDMPGKEEKIKEGTDIWRHALNSPLKDNFGTPPVLKSEKFTGYGYILRSEVGTPNEMTVYLQQIDEGPNYRWGRTGNGGNGVIYYYANGERYSFNRQEDVGDDNMGDAQACSNFAVLMDNVYRSVGRNELTEPLYDFGFAQFARVNAAEGFSYPFYRSRSVMMSGNDYIVIYDEVGDVGVYGRFSWFVKEGEKFPSIYQLKPGVAGVDTEPGIPLDGKNNYNVPNNSTGKHYDGYGNFLTVVSHHGEAFLPGVSAAEYGAKVVLKGRTDMIFRDSSEIDYSKGDICFKGYAGIIRFHGKKIEAAVFNGWKIGAGGVEVEIRPGSKGNKEYGGIAFTIEEGRLFGHCFSRNSQQVEVTLSSENDRDISEYRLFMDSATWEYSNEGNTIYFIIPEGKHTWQWTDRQPKPAPTEITAVEVSSGKAKLFWEHASGASGYDVAISEDGGENWRTAVKNTSENFFTIEGLKNDTKIHVKVRSVNTDEFGEWSSMYPVYVTDAEPDYPEGLRIWKQEAGGYRITWGSVLGAVKYRLYRHVTGTKDFEMIYEGEKREYTDKTANPDSTYEYRISAVNGNGEGNFSYIRDTAPGGLVDWDPRPSEHFRRDTESHEHRYRGFDFRNDGSKRILEYPE